VSLGVLLGAFFVLSGMGVLSAALLSERRALQSLAWVGSAASLVIWTVGALAIAAQNAFTVNLWSLPPLGCLTLSVDRLSGLFLLVSALVFLLTSIYSLGYLRPYTGQFSIRALCACYFALYAAVVVVLTAGEVFTFLVGWELMALFAYGVINYQKRGEEDARPGYLMVTMGEAGFVAVVLAFLVMAAGSSGNLAFPEMRAHLASVGWQARWIVFLLSFFGFGVKAGLAPFNRWLPQAHPIAPANISALLSGALLNLGIYGIVRVNMDLMPPTTVGPGLLVLLVGTSSALTGILYANRTNDMKEMLANSSIENMGIIAAGLGAGMVFMAVGEPVLAGIAWIAAFYQMTNHSVYKSLLFFGAGAIDASAGTRDMDRLGGLIKPMPWIAMTFLIGALSIAAFPPLSGFASEWLTLQSLLQSAALASRPVKVVFALCGAGLALTAGLAVTCFAKTYSMSFLGMPRSDKKYKFARASSPIRIATGLSAALCVLLGVVPTFVIPVFGRVVEAVGATGATAALVPPFFKSASERPLLPPAFVDEFHDLGAQVGKGLVPGSGLVVLHRGSSHNPVVFAMSTTYMSIVLLLLTALLVFVVRELVSRRSKSARAAPWAGGLAALRPEMTYTATGFSNPVAVTFSAIFNPTLSEERLEVIAGHFRQRLTRVVAEVHVLDRVLFQPLAKRTLAVAGTLSRMHHGRLNAYAAYVLGTLLVVLFLDQTHVQDHLSFGPALILIVVLLLDRVL